MNVDFLLAEDLRQEANGKLTVLGLFPGAIVVFLKGARPKNVPADAPQGLEKLCIIALISDIEQNKTYKFKGQLFTPSGEPYGSEIDLGQAQIASGAAHTVLVQLKPFVPKEFGRYSFHLFVDENKFSFTMEMRQEA